MIFLAVRSVLAVIAEVYVICAFRQKEIVVFLSGSFRVPRGIAEMDFPVAVWQTRLRRCAGEAVFRPEGAIEVHAVESLQRNRLVAAVAGIGYICRPFDITQPIRQRSIGFGVECADNIDFLTIGKLQIGKRGMGNGIAEQDAGFVVDEETSVHTGFQPSVHLIEQRHTVNAIRLHHHFGRNGGIGGIKRHLAAAAPRFRTEIRRNQQRNLFPVIQIIIAVAPLTVVTRQITCRAAGTAASDHPDRPVRACRVGIGNRYGFAVLTHLDIRRECQLVGLSGEGNIAGILGGGGFGTPDSAVRGKLRRNRHISVRQTRSAAPIVAIQTDCGGSNAVLVGNDIFMRPSGDINSQSLERMSLIIADTRGDGSHLINLRVHFDCQFVDPVGYIALLPQSANLVAGVIGHDCLRVAAQ